MSETYKYKTQECDDDIDAIRKLCKGRTPEESKKTREEELEKCRLLVAEAIEKAQDVKAGDENGTDT